eukprot:scaffold707_cov399-Prasinococcus_capsulatus_cf.AAC.17
MSATLAEGVVGLLLLRGFYFASFNRENVTFSSSPISTHPRLEPLSLDTTLSAKTADPPSQAKRYHVGSEADDDGAQAVASFSSERRAVLRGNEGIFAEPRGETRRQDRPATASDSDASSLAAENTEDAQVDQASVRLREERLRQRGRDPGSFRKVRAQNTLRYLHVSAGSRGSKVCYRVLARLPGHSCHQRNSGKK